MPENNKKRLLPWRYAESLTTCSLFWIPVKFDTVPEGQKEWLITFLSKLSRQLEQTHQLHSEHFMEMQTIDGNEAVRKQFLNSMLKETPLTGVSRRPLQPEPAVPSTEDIEAFAKKKRPYQPYDYMPTTSYWFLDRNDVQIRQSYLGYGGMTILYRKQEPENENHSFALTPPVPIMIPKFLRADAHLMQLLEGFDLRNPTQMPAFLKNHPGMKQMFSTMDVDKVQEKGNKLLSSFRDQSKQAFGKDMQHDLQFEALPFILPRLSSQDFFVHTAIEISSWFEVFDIYLAEIPQDEGIVMACKDNQIELVAAIVEEMREEGYRYWEG